MPISYIYPLVLRTPNAVLIQGGLPLYLKYSKVKIVATVRFKAWTLANTKKLVFFTYL